ncbi:MAG: homoserine O-succinyltransferase, partial [Oscillospiraceae bacterium]|nr:homoserine O-succinyltransferase [Oscillospiraceae bacterium]
KMFGVFPHKAEVTNHPLLRGFDEKFNVPHSRHTEIKRMDVEKVKQLHILASSPESGVNIIADETERQFFITGHFEYDRFTLANEYFRDKDKGLPIDVPKHYFPYDDPSQPPHFNWRAHANLLFSNWLNYCVYQKTPFNLDNLESLI